MSTVRHAWIDELCARLEQVLIGRLAEELLAGELPERAAVVVAPVWRWLVPRIDMGRKTHRTDGAAMLMPVRMTWQPSPLMLVTAPVQVAWSMVGLGNSGAGTLELIPCEGAPTRTGDEFPTDGELGVPTMDARQVRARLNRLAEDGRRARWEALMSLEGYVTRAVRGAVVAVSHDVAGDLQDDRPTWVLDETGSQGVADRMLLGTGGRPGPVSNLLDRCLKPAAFVRVDPLKYVVTDLHRSADDEVRRTIDDPRIGRKIRAVRRTMPSAPLTEVIAAYRDRHPGDHLSTVRATRALSAGVDVMASVQSLDRVVAAVPSFDDLVAARVDRQRSVSR